MRLWALGHLENRQKRDGKETVERRREEEPYQATGLRIAEEQTNARPESRRKSNRDLALRLPGPRSPESPHLRFPAVRAGPGIRLRRMRGRNTPSPEQMS